MQFQKPLTHDQAQPKKQRVGRLAQVFAQPPDDFDVGLLDHVRGIDPRLQSAIEAQLHHAAQACPMPADELIESLLVAGTGPFQKASRDGGVVVHIASPSDINSEKERYTGQVEMDSLKNSLVQSSHGICKCRRSNPSSANHRGDG